MNDRHKNDSKQSTIYRTKLLIQNNALRLTMIV